jgi:hypothetical protein
MDGRPYLFLCLHLAPEGVIMKPSQKRDPGRSRRYPLKKHSFAVVRSNNHLLDEIDSLSKGEIAFTIIKSKPPRMGRIVEISRNGLTFDYIENDEACSRNAEMDILVVDDNFHIRRLPFELVKDALLESDVPFNSLTMKRMTVEFNSLTYQQKRKLDHFLEYYTSGKDS